MRGRGGWVSAVGAACLAGCLDDGGCQPDIDVHNDVDPAFGTPAELVSLGDDALSIWQVRWDNPVVGDTSFDLSGQSAQRIQNTWHFHRFDMWANWATFGSAPEVVIGEQTWPQFDGAYDTFLAWEMHGLRLPPRLTGDPFEALSTVQAIREGCDGNPSRYKGVGRFQLAPDVALVPVRVVVFYPDDGSVPADWVSEKDAELLFDDQWSGNVVRRASDNCYTQDVNGMWAHRAGCAGQSGCETVVEARGTSASGMVQPDRIWDQCGVQFRLVGYHQCEIPRQFFSPAEGPCGQFGDIGRLNTLVNAYASIACGVPHDATSEAQVLFVDRLTPPNCSDFSVGLWNNGSSIAISSLGVFQRGLTVAHELGHFLGGLDDLESCTDDNLLMCGASTEQGTIIQEEECRVAHATALMKQANYWGAP